MLRRSDKTKAFGSVADIVGTVEEQAGVVSDLHHSSPCSSQHTARANTHMPCALSGHHQPLNARVAEQCTG